MSYSYNEPDLFVIAKVAAPKTYRTYNPSTLEDFISYLEEDIADALADSGFVCVDENRIQQQAEKTASWWWTNVFQKDRLPQNQKEALKKTAVEGLTQLKNFKACIVDTETTGLGNDDRIIELSIIDMLGNTLFTSLFNPGIKLPGKITEITGITDGMLRDQPTFASKAVEISDLLRRYIITGWNVPFDARMLDNEFTKASLAYKCSNVHDLMPLCAKILGYEGGYLKLLKAKEELGIGDNQEHRSLADCLDTLAVLNATIKKAQKGGGQPDLPFKM